MKYIFLLLISFNCFADYHQFTARYQAGKELSDLDSDNLVGIGFEFKRNFGKFFYVGEIHYQEGGSLDQRGLEIGGGYEFSNIRFTYKYFNEGLHEYWDSGKTSKGSPIVVKDSDSRELHRIKFEHILDFDRYILEYGYSASWLPSERDKYQHGAHATGIYKYDDRLSLVARCDYYLDYEFSERYLDSPLFQIGFRYIL